MWLSAIGLLLCVSSLVWLLIVKLGSQGQQVASDNPSEWEIFEKALAESDQAKELLDDADDPSTPSRRRKVKEAEERIERGRRIVANLPEELQQLYEWNVEAILEARAARLTLEEGKLLDGFEGNRKLIQSMAHSGRAKLLAERVLKYLPEMEKKYRKK
jgi:hypothetical protein